MTLKTACAWTPRMAAAELLLGSPANHEAKEALELKIHEAILLGRLKAEQHHTHSSVNPRNVGQLPTKHYETASSPKDVIEWALSEDIDVPAEYREWYEHMTGSRSPVRIDSATHEKLLAAIAEFPREYPEFPARKPKLNDDIRPWLKANHAMSDREAHVFGTIIAEHFKL